MLQSARGPWLEQCMPTARDMKHPNYALGQLQPTPGVSVQRIRNSYNPTAPPKFRRVVRRIGPDGQVQYNFVQDEKGLYNKDGTYATQQPSFVSLKHDTSALETSNQDALQSPTRSRPVIADHSERMLRQAPDSPMDTQRSTERIRNLQALLGDGIAESHGKPPPRAAPFYVSFTTHTTLSPLQQSGAVVSAEEADYATPVALPIG